MMKLIIYLFLLISIVTAKKTILLSNDDSWVSAEIRAVYRDLKAAMYDVILVAPVSQRSGYGGKFDVPSSNVLEEDGEFGYVKKGEPAWGHEEDDDHIWYFNGTPASTVAFAFDYLLPNHFSNVTIDLVVGGVNQGPNAGPAFLTASGTMGAVENGIYRGYPGISFLGLNQNNSFFKDSTDDPLEHYNIYSSKVVELIDEIIDNDPVLPPLTGLNVNFPSVGYMLDNETSCTDPQWTLAAMLNGGILNQRVIYDEDSNTFLWGYKYFPNIQQNCNTTVCQLPAEFLLMEEDECKSSVSVFSINYNAPAVDVNAISTELKDLF